MELKDLIKHMRESAGLTRKQVGEILEISDKTVQGYEYGMNKKISESYLEKFAKLTGYQSVIYKYHSKIKTIGEIETFELCTFSKAINLISLYSEVSIRNIKWTFMEGYLPNKLIRVQNIDNVNKFFNDAIIRDDKDTRPKLLKPYTYENEKEARIIFIQDALKMICAISIFKPSEFGLTVEYCVEANCPQDEINCMMELENSGKAITKENLKNSKLFDMERMRKSLDKDSESKEINHLRAKLRNAEELYELFQYAPKIEQDRITAKLKKYKEMVLDGEEVLKIATEANKTK